MIKMCELCVEVCEKCVGSGEVKIPGWQHHLTVHRHKQFLRTPTEAMHVYISTRNMLEK